MENQKTPTPSGTPPGAASAGSGQPSPLRRFLVQFTLAACEEFEAPTAAAALSDAENSDAPPLGDFTGLGSQVVAEWDPVAEDWKDTQAALDLSAAPVTQNPFKPDLSRVSAEYLAAELYRRMRAGECVGLILTPGDLAEYWESDDSGATHPGSRVPEAEEMHAIRKAFERWQDTGGFHDIMHTCRDAWQSERARQLDQEGGSK